MQYWKTCFRILIVASLASIFLATASSASTEKVLSAELAEIDARIPSMLKEWNVPGLSLAVVRDGEVALVRGYGVLEEGKAREVDADTLFSIGSITKSFTAACIGLLVEDRIMHWDDPIIHHLPDFLLRDPWFTREVTIRDVLSHRSGIIANNVVIWDSKLSREELLRRQRYRDVGEFRSGFNYTNIGYLAAGQAISGAADLSWDDCVRERLFAPLGMERSAVHLDEFAEDPNAASAHVRDAGNMRPHPRLDPDNIAPSGSIYSSAREMTRWLLAHLQDGQANDQQVLPAAVVSEMRRPWNPINEPFINAVEPGSKMFAAYGLGWFLGDFQGSLRVSHGGRSRGMSAYLGMAPDQGFGFVVLTNAQDTFLATRLGYELYDALHGKSTGDWEAHFRGMMEQSNAALAARMNPKPLPGTSPTHDLESYAGTYRHEFYGAAQVRYEDGALTIELTDLGYSASLTHHHFDSFQADWGMGEFGMIGRLIPIISFTLDARGEIKSLTPGSSIFVRQTQ